MSDKLFDMMMNAEKHEWTFRSFFACGHLIYRLNKEYGDLTCENIFKNK